LLKLPPDTRLRNLRLRELEQVDVLPEPRRSLIGPCLAGDDVHHRGLASAVRADDAAQFARIHVQRQAVERLEAVEADGDPFEVQNLAEQLGWRPPPRGPPPPAAPAPPCPRR